MLAYSIMWSCPGSQAEPHLYSPGGQTGRFVPSTTTNAGDARIHANVDGFFCDWEGGLPWKNAGLHYRNAVGRTRPDPPDQRWRRELGFILKAIHGDTVPDH